MLSPKALADRYDRLSFRVTPGIKSKLAYLAAHDGVLPTEWVETVITRSYAELRAYEREQRKDRQPVDAGKGEWRCGCKPDREFDTSVNPRNVSACLKCGAARPKKSKKDPKTG